MSNGLWAAAVRKGTAANKPTVPDFPSDTFGFYYETDTDILYFGEAGGAGWVAQIASAVAPPAIGGTTPAAGTFTALTSTSELYSAQPTPTAKVTDATLTIAELLTNIVTATKATAVALTLPTGTLTDAGILAGALAVDQSFDWSVINLGSVTGDVTMTAGTDHTYVGNAVVVINTSARFRTRKTVANTFVTYRIA